VGETHGVRIYHSFNPYKREENKVKILHEICEGKNGRDGNEKPKPFVWGLMKPETQSNSNR